jgi:hypothetical protein
MVEPGDRDDHGTGNNDGTRTRPVLIIGGDDTAGGFAIPIENPRREETPRPVLDWLLRRRRPEVDRRKVNVKTSFQVLVKQMAPRKTIRIDLEKALLTGDSLSRLQEELNETSSTGHAMRDIIEDIFREDTVPVSVPDTLFEIIGQDTSTLLRVLSEILSDTWRSIFSTTRRWKIDWHCGVSSSVKPSESCWNSKHLPGTF